MFKANFHVIHISIQLPFPSPQEVLREPLQVRQRRRQTGRDPGMKFALHGVSHGTNLLLGLAWKRHLPAEAAAARQGLPVLVWPLQRGFELIGFTFEFLASVPSFAFVICRYQFIKPGGCIE